MVVHKPTYKKWWFDFQGKDHTHRKCEQPYNVFRLKNKPAKTSPLFFLKVGLFLVAVVFLLCGFSTSINALNHGLVDFDGVTWQRKFWRGKFV